MDMLNLNNNFQEDILKENYETELLKKEQLLEEEIFDKNINEQDRENKDLEKINKDLKTLFEKSEAENNKINLNNFKNTKK